MILLCAETYSINWIITVLQCRIFVSIMINYGIGQKTNLYRRPSERMYVVKYKFTSMLSILLQFV